MSTHKQFQSRSLEIKDHSPLWRTQKFLKELKIVVALARELLVEVKELVVLVAMILFFIWSALHLFH